MDESFRPNSLGTVDQAPHEGHHLALVESARAVCVQVAEDLVELPLVSHFIPELVLHELPSLMLVKLAGAVLIVIAPDLVDDGA